MHFPSLFLRDAQLVRRPEEMRKSQSRITRDSTSAIQDLGDTIRWNIELACKLSSARTKLFSFVGEMFSRVNCGNCHNVSPNGGQRSRHLMDQVTLLATQSRSAIGR